MRHRHTKALVIPSTVPAVLAELQHRLAQRMAAVNADIHQDYVIDADPYDNIARLKELQRVERWIRALTPPHTDPPAAHAGDGMPGCPS